jgi:hypothetical protein
LRDSVNEEFSCGRDLMCSWPPRRRQRFSASPNSHSLAYCLHGESVGDRDLYVMINAYWKPLTLQIQDHGS